MTQKILVFFFFSIIFQHSCESKEILINFNQWQNPVYSYNDADSLYLLKCNGEDELIKIQLFNALKNGNTKVVKNLLKEIHNLDYLKRIKVLFYQQYVKSVEFEVTGLYLALKNGYIETVSVFFEESSNLLLNFQDLIKLLTCFIEDKSLGICATLSHSLDMTNRYLYLVKKILNSLNYRDIRNIILNLLLCDQNYIVHLPIAMHSNNPEVVDFLLNEISNLNLDSQTIFNLLNYHNMQGCSAFFMAAHDGNIEVTRIFLQWLNKLPLDSQHKFDLLISYSKDQIPALHIAMQNGNTKTVEVILTEGEKIINSFPDDSNKELFFIDFLSAIRKDGGVYGLYISLQQGNVKTIDVYMAMTIKIINNFRDQQTILILLFNLFSCKDKLGVPGFVAALLTGQTPALITFFNNLLKVDFALIDVISLLSFKLNNLFSFEMARKAGYQDTSDVFLAQLSRFNLTINELIDDVQ